MQISPAQMAVKIQMGLELLLRMQSTASNPGFDLMALGELLHIHRKILQALANSEIVQSVDEFLQEQ